MDSQKLDRVFAEVKQKAGLDYAITDTDQYGDCMTCVNSELAIRFGVHSKGIFVKVWKHGMNAADGVEEHESVNIAHDLTEEQHRMVKDLLAAHYNVKWDGSAIRCIEISEKNT